MKIVCCHGNRSANTAYEAVVQCATCKGCWHEGCLKVFNGCCDNIVKIIATNSTEFERNGLGAT
jgi:hypothetical protein